MQLKFLFTLTILAANNLRAEVIDFRPLDSKQELIKFFDQGVIPGLRIITESYMKLTADEKDVLAELAFEFKDHVIVTYNNYQDLFGKLKNPYFEIFAKMGEMELDVRFKGRKEQIRNFLEMCALMYSSLAYMYYNLEEADKDKFAQFIMDLMQFKPQTEYAQAFGSIIIKLQTTAMKIAMENN